MSGAPTLSTIFQVYIQEVLSTNVQASIGQGAKQRWTELGFSLLSRAMREAVTSAVYNYGLKLVVANSTYRQSIGDKAWGIY